MSKKHKKKRTDTTKVEYKVVRPLLTGLQKGEHQYTEVLEATVVNICRAYNITYADIQQFLKNRGFSGIPKNGKITEGHVLSQLDFDFGRHKAEWDRIHPSRILVGIKTDKSKDNNVVGNKEVSNDNEDYRIKLENVHRLKQYDVNENKLTGSHPLNQNDIKNRDLKEASHFKEHNVNKQKKIEDTVNPSRQNNAARPKLKITKNIFISPKKTVEFVGKKLHSYFTDQQAANICSKMTDSYPRSLANRLDNDKNNKQILYQLHSIANKALQIFGGEVLAFLLNLRKLEFKNSEALELKTYYNVVPDFPVITLKSSNELFKVAFFAKQTRKGVSRDVRIFNKENVEIGFVDEVGRIESKLDKFKPHLSLFYDITQSGSYELYSGVESGECEVCHRKLVHPLSVRVGIGPTCAVNIGLDKTIYNFSI